MQTVLSLPVTPNAGYSADQITDEGRGTSLAELRDMVEEAIADYGENALVVTEDLSSHYGVRFGCLMPLDLDVVEEDDR